MFKLKFFLVFLLTFALIEVSKASDLCKLSGWVKDTQGEPIVGANVTISGLSVGTYANSEGYYTITLSKGNYQFTFSSIGYDSKVVSLDLGRNSLAYNVELLDTQQALEQINVFSAANSRNVLSTEMSVNTLSAEIINRTPQLMGEVDVIKTMQLMPGVSQSSEGSSGYSVRGGTSDQNLILLDGGNIYNPSHLMGFFSVFNNDVIEQATMYRSGFPAKYGGRLSSILEVETKNEVDDKFTGSGGVGLISARIAMMGTSSDSKLFWSVAARRSYADLFLKLSSDEQLKDMALNFYDFNGKLTYNFSDFSSISVGGYYGRDNMGMEMLDFSYGNAMTYASWKYVFSPRLKADLSFIWSRYAYDISSEMYIAETSWKSVISSPSLRYDMSYFVTNNNLMSFGASSFYHYLNPGELSLYSFFSQGAEQYNATETTFYVSDKHTFNSGVSLTGVLRYNIFSNKSDAAPATYNALDLRAGIMIPLNNNNSIKASIERNNQFVQWANNSVSGSPLNVWFAASSNVKPQISEQYSVGYFHNLKDNMFELSAEAYYKNYHNVIDFIDNAVLFGKIDLESQIRTGTGYSYGLELMVSKTYGRWTGFANYTYSHSEFNIPEINNGKSYLSPYDRPHAFNITVNWQATKKWNLSMLWVYYTGSPASFPEYYVQVDNNLVPIYTDRNTYRMRDYHRMDVSATYVPKPDKVGSRGEWNFSIYNLYYRKNTWMYEFSAEQVKNYYLFGIIPSVSYNFTF